VSGEVETRPACQLIRDHEFGIKVFGEPFQPAGRVERVAYRREARRLAIAHLPDNRRPDMKGHSDLEGAVEFASVGLIEAGHSLMDAERGVNRLLRGPPGITAQAKQREGSVANKLVDMPPGLLDRMPTTSK
jgi:hypothetical protein